MHCSTCHALPCECFQHQINKRFTSKSWILFTCTQAPRGHLMLQCSTTCSVTLLFLCPPLHRGRNVFFYYIMQQRSSTEMPLETESMSEVCVLNERCRCCSHLRLVFAVSWFTVACLFSHAMHTKEQTDISAEQPEHGPWYTADLGFLSLRFTFTLLSPRGSFHRWGSTTLPFH